MSRNWLWLMASSRRTEVPVDGSPFRRIPDPYDFTGNDPLLRSLRSSAVNLLIGMAYPEFLSVAILRQRRFTGEILTVTEFLARTSESEAEAAKSRVPGTESTEASCSGVDSGVGLVVEKEPDPGVSTKASCSGVESGTASEVESTVEGDPRRIVVFDSRRPWDDRLTAPGFCGNRPSPAETVAFLPIGRPTRNRWYPVIDRNRCDGCGDCVAFCPFRVYGEGSESEVKVVHPDECRPDCVACARICPRLAIFFPYSIEPEISGEDPAQPDYGPSGEPVVRAERRHRAESERATQTRNRTRPTPVPSQESREEAIHRWMDQLDELEDDEPESEGQEPDGR
ncbi:MAG: ferredoxin family protein [Planctomycetia bacterium]|nr:ferredoxin family protein [Planctomycetia bacterium]